MTADDSTLDTAATAEARALLEPPRRRERLWPVVLAAACLALASIAFAVAMIVAPPVVKEHTVKSAP